VAYLIEHRRYQHRPGRRWGIGLGEIALINIARPHYYGFETFPFSRVVLFRCGLWTLTGSMRLFYVASHDSISQWPY
jgi:hypothetical protein